MSFLQVAGIGFEENQQPVLQQISFSQGEFRKLAVAGETGSGKSTLLQIIAGLVQPSAGQVRFESERVKGPAEVLVPGHPGIAYLSQQFELPQFLRVEQVLRYASKLPAEEAHTLYEVCRIGHLLNRKTNQLSGGERQRIALTRLLLTRPRLLLLDEPFSNLDMGHKDTLKSVIHDIGQELEITCTLISHDPHDTLSWADEILVLQHGRLVQQGPPEQIYRQPVNAYAAALFGRYNLIGEALAQWTGMRLNGKKMLVRPESFQLASAGPQALAGRVQQVSFFGSHYELQVLLAGGTVTVKTASRPPDPGQAVHLALPAGDIWWV